MANAAAHADFESSSTGCAATFEAMPVSVVLGAVAVAGLGFGGHARMAVVVDSVVVVVAPVVEGGENVTGVVAAATAVEIEAATPAVKILTAVAVATVAMAVVDDNMACWCVPAKLPA